MEKFKNKITELLSINDTPEDTNTLINALYILLEDSISLEEESLDYEMVEYFSDCIRRKIAGFEKEYYQKIEKQLLEDACDSKDMDLFIKAFLINMNIGLLLQKAYVKLRPKIEYKHFYYGDVYNDEYELRAGLITGEINSLYARHEYIKEIDSQLENKHEDQITQLYNSLKSFIEDQTMPIDFENYKKIRKDVKNRWSEKLNLNEKAADSHIKNYTLLTDYRPIDMRMSCFDTFLVTPNDAKDNFIKIFDECDSICHDFIDFDASGYYDRSGGFIGYYEEKKEFVFAVNRSVDAESDYIPYERAILKIGTEARIVLTYKNVDRLLADKLFENLKNTFGENDKAIPKKLDKDLYRLNYYEDDKIYALASSITSALLDASMLELSLHFLILSNKLSANDDGDWSDYMGEDDDFPPYAWQKQVECDYIWYPYDLDKKLASMSHVDLLFLIVMDDFGEDYLKKFIKQAHPNLNELNAEGESVLGICAYYDDVEILTLLLKHGANVNVLDSKGSSPLDYAIENACEKAIILLKEYGGKEASEL